MLLTSKNQVVAEEVSSTFEEQTVVEEVPSMLGNQVVNDADPIEVSKDEQFETVLKIFHQQKNLIMLSFLVN